MGQVTHFWQLVPLTTITWFTGGALIVLDSILAGLGALPQDRGKIFGMLAFTTALAGVLGGVTGPIVDRWDYPVLFTIMGTADGVTLGFLRVGEPEQLQHHVMEEDATVGRQNLGR
jgi:hypothetical protein